MRPGGEPVEELETDHLDGDIVAASMFMSHPALEEYWSVGYVGWSRGKPNNESPSLLQCGTAHSFFQ